MHAFFTGTALMTDSLSLRLSRPKCSIKPSDSEQRAVLYVSSLNITHVQDQVCWPVDCPAVNQGGHSSSFDANFCTSFTGLMTTYVDRVLDIFLLCDKIMNHDIFFYSHFLHVGICIHIYRCDTCLISHCHAFYP